MDLDFLLDLADHELDIQRVRLADLQDDIVNDFGLETGIADGHFVTANRQSRKAVITLGIGWLLLTDSRIHGQGCDPGARDHSFRRIGHRAFQLSAIHLREQHRRSEDKQQDTEDENRCELQTEGETLGGGLRFHDFSSLSEPRPLLYDENRQT